MTDRERWTIYPLLLLTLAVTLREKFFPPEIARMHVLQCHHLDILGADGKPQIVLGQTTSGASVIELLAADAKPRLALTSGDQKSPEAALTILGKDNKPVVFAGTEGQDHSAAIRLNSNDGRPQVVIGSAQNYGVISTVGPDRQQLVELAADNNGAGVFKLFDKNNQEQIILDTAAGAGRLRTMAQGRPVFAITCDEQGLGRALATDASGKLYLILQATVQVNPAPAPQATPNKPDEKNPANGKTPDAEKAIPDKAAEEKSSTGEPQEQPPGDQPSDSKSPASPAPEDNANRLAARYLV